MITPELYKLPIRILSIKYTFCIIFFFIFEQRPIKLLLGSKQQVQSDKQSFRVAGITDIGTRVQSAATASEISAAVASQLQLRRTAVDGVNLDEEAARLIQSQQAYQASAKVLQVAQSIFDTLLQTTA